ncbi:MAG: 5-formyltetrahydrofolate cyclo-ligase [Chlamydiota bacterium]
MTTTIKEQKAALRRLFLRKRGEISLARRLEASQKLSKTLLPLLKPFRYVLSFANFGGEIDLQPLNRLLAQEKQLALPRIGSNHQLFSYRVLDPERDLVEQGNWKILEPNPTHCSLIPVDEVSCVLVPGIVFDLYHDRLGYGKGYYDAFLRPLSCPSWGVGFQEQLIEKKLPVEPHDIQLTQLMLF